jgi:hypothetical protein
VYAVASGLCPGNGKLLAVRAWHELRRWSHQFGWRYHQRRFHFRGIGGGIEFRRRGDQFWRHDDQCWRRDYQLWGSDHWFWRHDDRFWRERDGLRRCD